MEIYVAPEVAEIRALHPCLEQAGFGARPIRDQLAIQARTLADAHATGDRRVAMQVMSWWPGARGRSSEEVMAGPFTQADALLTLAREHGFAAWQDVEALGDLAPDLAFEAALDEMLAGDEDALCKRLTQAPELASARTRLGHRATLLHYLAANGVESHRQIMPLNAARLARLLIRNGADIRAEADMYGGGQTPLDLASTSAHPRNAGVAEALNTVLGGG